MADSQVSSRVHVISYYKYLPANFEPFDQNSEELMENIWLTWAKRLQSIASNGLLFSSDQYERERYREVADIANQMLATLGNLPIGRIEDLVSDFELAMQLQRSMCVVQ